jgi:2-amino-4-hydroxy-6-hydroxymethyldihydropteridine diphosphokinase
MSQSAESGNALSVRVYLAIGSNIAPKSSIRLALSELANKFPDLRVSPAYQNTAVGFSGDDFINLVVCFGTTLSLADLLQAIHEVEAVCGRARNDPKWAPRCMDLDILLYGDLLGVFAGTVLPRPDLLKRAYMLGPLAALEPDLLHPTEHKTIAQLWQQFARQTHPLRPVDLSVD